jgi:hypothetical protein
LGFQVRDPVDQRLDDNVLCAARLIAFQKSVYPGHHPNPCVAMTGKPSVVCPHCKAATRFHRDQIERSQFVLT